MKKPFKAIKAFFRGAIKSFPIGNAILEGAENVKKEKVTAENITEAIDTTNKEKPHSWVSILTQLAFTSLFVYLFYTKQITAENLQEIVKLILSVF
jgi:hypothetical protein